LQFHSGFAGLGFVQKVNKAEEFQVSIGNESRVAEGLVEKTEVGSKVYCPGCGNDRPRRVERKGFMQLRIYPLFGYFPWYCKECRQYFLLRKRYRRKSSKKQYVERGR
jgi:hypothetical protein